MELAQEWGDNYRKPINECLKEAYPQIDSEKICELNNLSQETMKITQDSINLLAEKYGRKIDFKLWKSNFLKNYP